MAVYADWEFYSTEYFGTTSAEDEFPVLARRASVMLDRMTFNRIAAIVLADEDDDAEDIENIKLATCAIVDELKKQESEGRQVSSESIGSHSKSYVVTPDMQKTVAERIESVAALYLGNSGLMFRGFADSEYGGVADDDD